MSPTPAPPEPWYWSGTFWAIVGVGVAALGAIAAVVATYRSANPRRRLYVYTTEITPLVHQVGTELGLEVFAAGERLQDPHLVTAHVVSRSRRDIRKDAFDGSIELKFSARIVFVLSSGSSTKAAGTPVPDIFVRGATIEIPPVLLRRDHKLQYTVLVEGKPPKFSALVPIEADVRLEAPPDARHEDSWEAPKHIVMVATAWFGFSAWVVLHGDWIESLMTSLFMAAAFLVLVRGPRAKWYRP